MAVRNGLNLETEERYNFTVYTSTKAECDKKTFELVFPYPLLSCITATHCAEVVASCYMHCRCRTTLLTRLRNHGKHHRIIEMLVGRDFQRSLSPASCLKQDQHHQQIRSAMALSELVQKAQE